jgi:hypothetical protein
MNKRNAARDAANARKRATKLGPDAVCVLCGFSDADALTPVSRTVIEAHHVLGRQHDGKATLPVCANCHRSLTAQVERAGASMENTPNLLERLASILRALGVCLLNVGRALLSYADQLAQAIPGLDQNHAGWRETVEAR